MAGQNLGRFRPLQRQQGAMRRAREPDVRGQGGLKMGEIHLLARGVDDQHEHAVLGGVGGARDHQIVDDSTVRGGELRIALPAGREVEDVRRAKAFQRAGRRLVGRADQEGLPHVRNIEQSGFRAGVQVLCQHAGRIMHGHVMAREGDHLAA